MRNFNFWLQEIPAALSQTEPTQYKCMEKPQWGEEVEFF